MLGYGIPSSKGRLFFDRSRVEGAVDRATRRVLSRFGAFVRTRARSSIRRRKTTSKPGRPPHAHVRDPRRSIKKITFSFEPRTKGVVIGPEILHGRPNRAVDNDGTVPETLEYGARAVYEEFDPTTKTFTRRPVDIEPRPFMGPAFEAEQPQLDDLWAGSVRS